MKRPFSRELLEAMDACRPGYDDVSAPEMADLAAHLASHPELDERFNRLQKLDATLAGAIQDVPVPEGLAPRLLAALSAAGTVDAAIAGPPAAAPADRRTAGRPVTGRAPLETHRRSRWLIVASGAVAAAVLLAVGLLQWSGTGQYTSTLVLDEAIARFNSPPQEPSQTVSDGSPHGFPISAGLSTWPGTRWRSIAGFVGRSGVAYDMKSARGTRATLYVVQRAVPGLRDEPPSSPPHGTGNCSAAAWQCNGLLYVLVVEGDAASYQEFLAPRGEIT